MHIYIICTESTLCFTLYSQIGSHHKQDILNFLLCFLEVHKAAALQIKYILLGRSTAQSEISPKTTNLCLL